MGRLTLIVGAVVCVQVSTASAQKLIVTAPSAAVGDGATAITVRVAIEPADATARAQGLDLTADGGTLGEASPDGDAGVAYEFVPPRVASETSVSLTASIKIGKRTITAKHKMAITPAPLPQGENASGGAFDLRAPARLLLGVHESADISVVAPAGATLRMRVNVGAVTELAPGPDGRLHATYSPPSNKFPQAVIVAVTTADSADFDWLSIALNAKASVALDSEAGASVVVRVGDADFGPVRMDRRGKAELVVSVPPGVTAATTIATDSLGNVKRASLALGAPPFNRLLAICPIADSRLRVLVLDERAAPAEREQLALAASTGALDEAKSLSPGVFAADYAAPDGAVVGDQVSMSASVDEGRHESACESIIPGEVPTAVVIALGRQTFEVGGAPIAVTLSFVYPGRLPALDVPVELKTDLGELSTPVRGDGRQLTAHWTLPDHLEGLASAQLVAELPAPAPSSSARVQLRPGPAARIEVVAGATELRADGASTTTIIVRAFDTHDNPQPEIELSASARGVIGSFERRGDHSLVATYTAPRSYSLQVDTVTVTAANAGAADTRIWLRALPRRFTASARIGYISNFAKVSGPMVALGASARPPVLGDYLAVGVEVAFHRSRTSQMNAGGTEEVTTIVDAFPIQATARLSWTVGSVALYLVGRAGIAVIDAGVDSPSSGRILLSETALAVSGGLGLDVAVGPGTAVVELGMLRAIVDSSAISGNAGGVQLGAGYRLGF